MRRMLAAVAALMLVGCASTPSFDPAYGSIRNGEEIKATADKPRTYIVTLHPHDWQRYIVTQTLGSSFGQDITEAATFGLIPVGDALFIYETGMNAYLQKHGKDCEIRRAEKIPNLRAAEFWLTCKVEPPKPFVLPATAGP